MSAGEIILVRFPFSPTEAKPFKQRPVLVLGSRGTGPDEAIFCVMITGNPERFARPRGGDIKIVGWQAAGLDTESVVRSRRMWTAERRDVTKIVGRVEDDVVALALAEVRLILDI